jgi:hypothetical protein
MSYGEYKFGDFMKNYDVGGPSDGLVGFAEGFAAGFVPAYAASNKAAADKELALAKLDRQAEIAAAKAKADTNTQHATWMTEANALADTIALPEGVKRNELVNLIYGMKKGGVGDTSILSQITGAIENGDLIRDGADTPANTTDKPEAAPVNTGPETPLDRQMNEALGGQSSAVTPDVNPDVAPTVEMSSVDAPEDDGSYQEASLGSGWEERYASSQAAKAKKGTEVLVASLDSQTDVTNPSGLGGGEGSASEVILASNTGTPSENFRATTGALKFRPKAKESAAEELKVESITSYEEALAAVVALRGVAGQEEKLQKASLLLDQFTKVPDLGGMDAQKLREFIASAPTNPEFANLNPQVMQGTLTRAEKYLADLNMAQLPSLTETDLTKLQGVQADIKSGRYSFEVSDTYKTELASRVSALEAKEEADKLEGLVFDEKYVERLGFLKYNEIQNDAELSSAEKIQAFDLWKANEGRQLQELLRFGDKPEKQQEINNLEELATQNLMNGAAYKAATPEVQQQMVLALKSALSAQKKDTLTSSEYAAEYASKTLDLSSDDPAVVAAAKSWFENVAPALQSGMQAAATASAKPGEQKTVTITYTTTDGQTRRASGVPTGTGYTLADGTEVLKGDVQNIVSDDDRDYTTKLRNSISVPRTKQRDGMNAMVDLSQQAYALEELAINDPVVLTLVGAGTSAVASAKREANTLFTMLQKSAEEAYNQGVSSQSVVEKVMSDFLKTNKVSDEVAANYKQFAAKLTRFIFAAGKTLGQEGNGFSNQDYTNILASLKAGNGVESFVKNLRSFVRERSIFTDAGANGLKKMSEVQELSDYGIDLGIETMTYDEYSKSDFAPEDFAAWLNSPIDSLKRNAEPPATTTAPLKRGDDGIFRLTPEGGTD